MATMIPGGSMLGGSTRDMYAEFRSRQVPEHLRPAFDDLREFCNSLGGNVIEDVRPHRVVFCKSMNTRWFADAKPVDDAADDDVRKGGGARNVVIRVKVRTGWRDPIRTIRIGGSDGVTSDVKEEIAAAYGAVR